MKCPSGRLLDLCPIHELRMESSIIRNGLVLVSSLFPTKVLFGLLLSVTRVVNKAWRVIIINEINNNNNK